MEPASDYEEFSDPLPFKPEKNFQDLALCNLPGAKAMDRQILEKKALETDDIGGEFEGEKVRKCVSA